MTEEYVMRIPAKTEGMDLILAFVSLLLDINGCSNKARTQLRMAVEEIYVNQTLYAYASGDGWVEMRGCVEIMLSGEERGIGGLGIYMVKTMVDELEYEYRDGCNRLMMRRRLHEES